MVRRVAAGLGLVMLMICGGCGALRAQSTVPDWQVAAGGTLAFEVATVRASPADAEPAVNFTLGPGDAYAKTGGRLRASGISLLDYVRFAYKLSDGQAGVLQASGPSWMATKTFDIDAKAANPNATKDQIRLMMQALLTERFGLKAHRETRELPVLALVVEKQGKLGPQLRAHAKGEEGCFMGGGGDTAVGPAVCGGLVSMGGASAPNHVRIGGSKISMALLAAHLGEMAGFDRPVVDETGLSGTFDLVLEWGPDAGSDAGAEDRQRDIEEALQDQLGLRLKRERAGVDVLVIDAIHPEPSEN